MEKYPKEQTKDEYYSISYSQNVYNIKTNGRVEDDMGNSY